MIPQISTVELLKLASGDIVSLQIYKFVGDRTGKKTYLQANLHGSEIVGNAVINELIKYFSSLDRTQINGEICLVPVCNPLGVNQRNHFFATGRFNSYDGKDWNRIFWDYEKECQDLEQFARTQIDLSPEEIRNNYLHKILTAFSQQWEKIQTASSVPYNDRYRYHLQSLCLDANYIIDLHSSSNQGTDYLYCFHDREESARYFLFDRAILMNKYDGDAFDEAFLKPWLALEKKFSELGRKIQFDVESWTLELGSGMQMNPESVQKGIIGIQNYLLFKGVLNIDREIESRDIIFTEKKKIKNYYATTGGMIQSRVALDTQVKQGQKLYSILAFNKQEKSPEIMEIYAESDGYIFDLTNNYSVNQGEYILGMMT